MPRTSITEAQIREALLQTAREAFLTDGIAATEMKAIAERSGLSRATVYRHAIDKNRLAFLVVERELRELIGLALPKNDTPEMSGYERLETFCRRMLDVYESHPRVLRLINEFDSIFTGDYPPIPEAQDYVITIQRVHNATVQLVLDGLADHTLTRIPNPELFASMLENTILGLSLRFFPREAHYLEESHQSARANIEEAIRVILAAVRA